MGNSLSAATPVYRLVSVLTEVQGPLGYPTVQVPETVQVGGRMGRLQVGNHDVGLVKACDLFEDPYYSDYNNHPPGRGLAVLLYQTLESVFMSVYK